MHESDTDGQRTPYERDYDSILYSSYFKRLAGVTQIVRAGEADVFHTRQQHTHKVAQIGRRIAQGLIKQANAQGITCSNLDAEVVAAAALAHDLGHPPFGHIGEKVLNNLVQEHGGEGYEGNAQTFRILTKLGVRFEFARGLNMTRAVLCAVLKYPWLRDINDANKSKKWSAYLSEKDEFEWARAGQKADVQSLEAHIMDWADDIAYSVHDLEDGHRCNLIPWNKIFSDSDEKCYLIAKTAANWHGGPSNAQELLRSAFDGTFAQAFKLWESDLQCNYDGSYNLRRRLREMTSALVGNFIDQTKICPDAGLVIDEKTKLLVMLMKQITREYIISNLALAAQQKGQKRILIDLFNIIYEDTKEEDGTIVQAPRFLPKRLHYLADLTKEKSRFVADCISGLTEREATDLHARLTGISYGSVLDPIVR